MFSGSFFIESLAPFYKKYAKLKTNRMMNIKIIILIIYNEYIIIYIYLKY